MQVIEVTSDEYNSYNFHSHVFNSLVFAEYNKNKCDEVKFLIFKDSKIRFGLIAGIKNNILKSPFSAPFGGLVCKGNNIKHNIYFSAIASLNEYKDIKKLASIEIFLAPSFYHKNDYAKITTALLMNNYQIDFIDINHSFNLENFNANYLSFIEHNARKSLKIGVNKKLNFHICNTLEEKKNAYDIIKQNRQERAFPLKLTYADILGTIEFVKSFFFTVSISESTFIASAICYEVQKGIIQVIYWGNLTQYSEYKSINFLSFKIFEYFKELEYKIVDIGPSSEKGIVNFGLSEFKESIGCDKYLKPHFTYRSRNVM